MHSLEHQICLYTVVSHPKEFLQELFGTVDVDAGNATISSKHSVHSGWDVLPVLLCLQVKGLIFNQVVLHPKLISNKYRRSLAFHTYLRCILGKLVHKSVYHFIKTCHTIKFPVIFKSASPRSLQKHISVLSMATLVTGCCWQNGCDVWCVFMSYTQHLMSQHGWIPNNTGFDTIHSIYRVQKPLFRGLCCVI